MIITSICGPICTPIAEPVGAGLRWAYNMDGIDDRWTLANRAINPDGDNTLEFWSPETSGVIIAQNIVATVNLREFTLYGDALGLYMNIGGVDNVICTAAQGFELGKKYWLSLVGSNFTLAKNSESNIIRSASFAKGAAREPAAQTIFGARANGTASTFSSYFKGIQRDIKINGTLWPIADRNHSIQLPEPSGLGAELITKAVLENPVEKGNQWTYLGDGRWQYIGDGSLNTLKFVLTNNQPTQGFFEFEIESISGAGGGITCTDTVPPNSVFTTVGLKRFFYTDKSVITSIAFKRAPAGTPVSCVVKNISFKPLGTCNPMTGANLNPDRWTEIPV